MHCCTGCIDMLHGHACVISVVSAIHTADAILAQGWRALSSFLAKKRWTLRITGSDSRTGGTAFALVRRCTTMLTWCGACLIWRGHVRRSPHLAFRMKCGPPRSGLTSLLAQCAGSKTGSPARGILLAHLRLSLRKHERTPSPADGAPIHGGTPM